MNGTIVHFADCSVCLGNIAIECSACKHRAAVEGEFPEYRAVSAYPTEAEPVTDTEDAMFALEVIEKTVWIVVGCSLVVCLAALTAVVIRETVTSG